MKKIIIVIIVIVLAGAGFWLFKNHQKTSAKIASQKPVANTQPMQIQSPVFSDGQSIPVKYTCDGQGVNPPLVFSNVPQTAQSLALVLSDPDAAGGTWIHWLVWNIDPAINAIAENSVPEKSVQGQASSGQENFGAPCPPSGTHHYIFSLYALDAMLAIPSYSTLTDLQKAMQGHIVGQAQLVGLYSKN